MTILEDYQFELDGYAFGHRLPISTDGEGFDRGESSIESQDFFNRLTQSNAYGRDAKAPSEWSWAAHTDDALNPHDAIAADRDLELAWGCLDDADPGEVVPLRYAMDGRTRVVFGRPRGFTSTRDNKILYGVINSTFRFSRSDNLYYADEVESIEFSTRQPTAQGIMTPVVTPVTTLIGTDPPGTTPVIGGDVPTPFKAVIHGPNSGSIVNPRISNGFWNIQLKTSIAASESVTISTYPWDMSAIRNDGANLSGFLTAESRLSKARLSPGGSSLRLYGVDSSGTARCTVSWRAAYKTI